MIYSIPFLSYFVLMVVAAAMGREHAPKNMLNIYLVIILVWYVLYVVIKLYKRWRSKIHL